MVESMVIDRALPMALHHQLRQGLEREITAGRLTAGEKLPTVREMSERHGLSFFTVTRALNDLARDGVIVTRRGSGCYVSERVETSTEIIIRRHPPRARNVPLAAYFDQFTEGVREGYDDPSRSVYVSYVEGRFPDVDALHGACRARHTDGVVVYRPPDEITETLRRLALRVPVASVFRSVPQSDVDAVLPEPKAALGRWLGEWLAAGRGKFAFLGYREPARASGAEESPYRDVQEAFTRTLAEAGVTGAVHLLPVSDWNMAELSDRIVEWSRATAATLAPDTVIVAQTPHVAEALTPGGPRQDLIAYTESRVSVEDFHGRFALLYAGIAEGARMATQLLRERASGEYRGPGRVVRLEAQAV